MSKRLKYLLTIVLSGFNLISLNANADFSISGMSMAGDGATPTTLQYLDTQQVNVKSNRDLGNTTSKGDVVYSFTFDLPPALLQPSLGVSYSSGAGYSREMPNGWSLNGLTEIQRPTGRAYKGCRFKTDCFNAEWILSGGAGSGTLIPSGKSDGKFFLKSSAGGLVTAIYDQNADTWQIHSGGQIFTLTAADTGKDSPHGTALWRVSQHQDASGNYIAYTYDETGVLTQVKYGGNLTTGDYHLVEINFSYSNNLHTRTDGSGGFINEYKKRLTTVSILSSKLAASLATLKSSYTLEWSMPDSEYGTYLLTTIKHTGGNSGTETVVKFDYSKFSTTASYRPKTGDIVPQSLGSNYSMSSMNGSSKSASSESLVDFNRDSLLDVMNFGVDSDFDPDVLAPLNVKGQTIDYQAQSFNFAEVRQTLVEKIMFEKRFVTYPFVTDENDENPLRSEPLEQLDAATGDTSFQDYPLYGVPNFEFSESFDVTDKNIRGNFSVTLNHVTDFDGDGYLDTIRSGNDAEWQVYYGNGGIGPIESISEIPPSTDPVLFEAGIPEYEDGWKYSQVSWRPNLRHTDNPPGESDFIMGLLDINGDGWLDAVAPSINMVWLKKPSRGGGFEAGRELGIPYTSSLSILPNIRNAKYEAMVVGGKTSQLPSECVQVCKINFEASPLFQGDGNSGSSVGCGGTDLEGSPVLDDPHTDEDTQEGMTSGSEDDDCLLGKGSTDTVNLTGTAGDVDDFFTHCTNECLEGGTLETPEQQRIYQTYETSNFIDLNGDGLADFVVATASSWKVYLNLGHSFQSVTWEAPLPYLSLVEEAEPNNFYYSSDDTEVKNLDENATYNRVYQTLIDVDQDGLLDLAIGVPPESGENSAQLLDNYDELVTYQRKWFKNIGTGFDLRPKDLPAWWPDEFTKTAVVSNNGYLPDGIPPSATYTISNITDVNGDGALDVVSIDKTGDGVSTITYGKTTKPQLLEKIDNNQGATTEITYRALSTVVPAGDFTQEQFTPSPRLLADTMSSKDFSSNQNSVTGIDYGYARQIDGIFQGFKERTVQQFINDVWQSKTVFSYELSRDFEPLALSQTIYTDSNLTFSPLLKRGTSPVAKKRIKTENTYGDYGEAGRSYRLLKSRINTEYGEKTGEKNFTQTYTWDGSGNLLTYKHDGGGKATDAISAAFTYAANGATPEETTFYRPKTKTITGYDILKNAARVMSKDTYYYDGQTTTTALLTKGLLSKTSSSSGWVDGCEALTGKFVSVSYTRGTRGEVTSAKDEATGMMVSQTLDFGGAVTKSQTNALGHTLNFTIDGQGLVTDMTDSNGLMISQTYDGFKRPLKKSVKDKNGKTYTLSESQYFRSAAPYYTLNKTYADSGAVEATSYGVQNGFGDTAQSWTQNHTGKFMVTNTLTDVRGLNLVTGHPSSQGAFSSGVSQAITTPFNQTYYDAFGEPREIIRDANVRTGSAVVYHDEPRQTVTKDEKGYLTRLTYDAHHRVIKVEQGKSGTYVTTGTYGYDAADRVTKFTDGKGVTYTYSYDGIGRLREVKYGNASGTMTSWFKNTYKGAFKTRMEDNLGGYTAWEFDKLGRVIKMTVSDPLPTATGSPAEPLVYSYVYDTVWKGVLASETYSYGTQPQSKTSYSYDELGREKRIANTFTAKDGTAPSPVFKYAHDLAGRVTELTFPSGKKTASAFSYGFLTGQKTANDTGVDYALTYDYNKWGLPSAVTASTGHNYTINYLTPLWPEKFGIKIGNAAITQSYSWLGNGLLNKRTESATKDGTNFTNTEHSFEYDNLKQLTRLFTPTETVETFAYDNAGNLTNLKDPLGANWTYTISPTLNQVSARISDKGGSENFTYDTVGRTKTWTGSLGGAREYYYDGLQRLRGITVAGAWQSVFDYDSNNNIIRRADNNPYTGQPKYDYRFRDWRFDAAKNLTTEIHNGYVATENGARIWKFAGYDGHVTATFDDAGTLKSKRSLGAYGANLSTSGSPWNWEAFHGSEKQDNLIHMGQRHLIEGTGQWLQAEPYIYKGNFKSIVNPLNFSNYRYSSNNPIILMDKSGNNPIETTGGKSIAVTRISSPSSNFTSLAGASRIFYQDTFAAAKESLMKTALASNPYGQQIRELGGAQLNCGSAAIALDRSLRGNPSQSDIEDSNGKPIDSTDATLIENTTGREFEFMGDRQQAIENIMEAMYAAGPGSTGIIHVGAWAVNGGFSFGATGGHYFNVANLEGTIVFLDAQSETGEFQGRDGTQIFLMITHDASKDGELKDVNPEDKSTSGGDSPTI